MRRSQLAAIVTSLLAALAVAGSATAEPASVSSKRAQAQSVMGQIQALDGRLEHAVDAFNLANERLDAIKGDLAENRVNLQIAAQNLRTAQRVLAARMVAIYTSEQNDSTLDVLVGSQSLEDLLDGLETVSRVSEQDSKVLTDVTRLRGEIVAPGRDSAGTATGRRSSSPSVPRTRRRSRVSSRSGSGCSRRSRARSRRFRRRSNGARRGSPRRLGPGSRRRSR
jgi:hypothetical protein